MEQKILTTYVIQKDLTPITTEKGEIFPFIISSDSVDSVGDVMNIDGCDTTTFDILKGVFYNHDTQGPAIATCEGLRTIGTSKGSALVGDTFFHEITEESIEKKKLVKAGVIKCASIQFIPLEYHQEPLTEEERVSAGLPNYVTTKTIFDKWRLLEYSIVNIPANIDAQIQLRKSLINSQQEETMPIEKAGATLSKSNKDKLMQAMNLINEVVGATEEAAPEEKSAEISELKQMVTDQAVLIEEMAAKIKELTTEKIEPETSEQKTLEAEVEVKIIGLQEYLARK